MTKHISSYPKLAQFESEFTDKFFALDGNILVQEKIDGSQISFMTKDGELYVRSKNVEIREGIAPMFDLAISKIESIRHLMKEGYTYRGEYVAKPKHNIMQYERVPHNHIVLFDIQDASGKYLHYKESQREAAQLAMESVVSYVLKTRDEVQLIIHRIPKQRSLLGGEAEGVVFKREAHDLLSPYDNKPVFIKVVREDIKEINHRKNKGFKRTDVIDEIIGKYKTDARWHKAVQHLKEQDKLLGTMRDMPALMREVQVDVFEECGSDIKDMLLEFFRHNISSGLVRGLPEFYKPIIEGSGNE